MKFCALLTASLILTSAAAVASPSINLMGNSHGITSVPLTSITEIVKQNINTGPQSPYAAIKVQPIYQASGKIDHLLVYLPSKTNYSFTITRINLIPTNDNQYTTGHIFKNYQLDSADWQQQPGNKAIPQCPDSKVEFVAATPAPYIATAKQYTEQVYQDAKSAGYKSVLLEGNDASIEAYQNYLTCPKLKGFYNIGHGYEEGILLSDGTLSSDDFQQMNKELHENAVIVFNSCLVFNDPMKSAVLDGTDPQKYAGGISELGIGSSEPASACFWNNAFSGKPLTKSFNRCVATDERDTWGIDGQGDEQLHKA